MRYKYLFIVVALATIGWLILDHWEKPIQKNKSIANQPTLSQDDKTRQADALIENVKAQQKTQNQEALSQQNAEQMDELYAQFDARRYSDDLLVEMASVFTEYVSCIDASWMTEMNLNRPTLERTQMLSDLKSYCQQMEKSYPVLKDGYYKNMDEQFFMNDSEHGLMSLMKSLHQEQTHEALNSTIQNLISESYRQKNGQFLSMVQLMTGYRHDVFAIESELLGGLDINYLQSIRNVALTKLSCNFQAGQTCSPIGRFMLERCSRDNTICGMAFDAWYQGSATSGIRADVELLISHYQNN